MAFLFPGFLWALTALAIPVIIHLFQLRRFKRIDFPNVRFLQEVSQRTRSRRQVKHWLVLLARLGAVAALVLAFAQPYLRDASGRAKTGDRAISLFIDDSWSMDGQNAGGRLLDQARSGAQDAVMTFSSTDRFQVITDRLEGKQQMLVGRDEAMQSVAQVDVGPFSRNLSQVMARQREALTRSEAPIHRALLFTDLQRSITDVDAWTDDSTCRTVIVPLPPTSPDNLSLDSAWFSSPVRRMGQAEVLNVRIRNHGEKDLENVPVRLSVDGKERALATFSVAGSAFVDTVLRFTNDHAGAHWAEVAITDRPVTFDDNLFLSWRTTKAIRVLLVSGGDNESDERITSAYPLDSSYVFSVQPYRSIDLGALQRSDLVILNALPEMPSGLTQALRDHARAGGSVCVFPAMKSDAPSYNAMLGLFSVASLGAMDTSSIKVDRVDMQEPFYRDIFTTLNRNVDLPQVRARYAITAPAGADVLMRLQDGRPWLMRVPAGKGQLYFCASPLDPSGGNFTQHSFFGISLLRMGELSNPMGPLYHAIGDGEAIPLQTMDAGSEAAPHLKGRAGEDLVPEMRRTPGGVSIFLHELDLPAGPYAVMLGADTLEMLALNAPRTESDLRTWSVEELRSRIAERGLTTFTVLDAGIDDVAQGLNELEQGRKLWWWFVLLALVFLATETLLIRYMP